MWLIWSLIFKCNSESSYEGRLFRHDRTPGPVSAHDSCAYSAGYLNVCLSNLYNVCISKVWFGAGNRILVRWGKLYVYSKTLSEKTTLPAKKTSWSQESPEPDRRYSYTNLLYTQLGLVFSLEKWKHMPWSFKSLCSPSHTFQTLHQPILGNVRQQRENSMVMRLYIFKICVSVWSKQNKPYPAVYISQSITSILSGSWKSRVLNDSCVFVLPLW